MTHQVERNLKTVEAIGFQVRNEIFVFAFPFQIDSYMTYLLLNPGQVSFWIVPTERFAPSVASSQIKRVACLSQGTEKNRDAAVSLLDALGECAVDLIGKTTFIRSGGISRAMLDYAIQPQQPLRCIC
jgi:hypothetical protein